MSRKIKFSLPTIITLVLVSLTIISGAILASPNSVATDPNEIEDNIVLNIPMTCTLQGTGMNTHTATITNGTYRSEIGTTTLKAICNDSEGFAIYAIGFTNDEYGNNYLVGENTGEEIETGADVEGDFGTSNWSMKLSTDQNADYPLDIEPGFDDYIEVPPAYELVASRDSGTDVGSSAVGATLTTTYSVYISKSQPADVYNGQVKYTLVHPASADAPLPSTWINLNVEKDVNGQGYGDTIDYAITVTNVGDYEAVDISVKAYILEEETEEWTIGSLEPGKSITLDTTQVIGEDEIAATLASITVHAHGRNTNDNIITVNTPVFDNPPIIDDP